MSYTARQNHKTAPKMAVVIQPMVDVRSAGVAYSIHSVTGRPNQVMINAEPGLAASLVDGTVQQDQYVVEVTRERLPIRVCKRILAYHSQRMVVSKEGLQVERFDAATRIQSSLIDAQLFSLA